MIGRFTIGAEGQKTQSSLLAQLSSFTEVRESDFSVFKRHGRTLAERGVFRTLADLEKVRVLVQALEVVKSLFEGAAQIPDSFGRPSERGKYFSQIEEVLGVHEARLHHSAVGAVFGKNGRVEDERHSILFHGLRIFLDVSVRGSDNVIGRVVRPSKSALDRRWATAWAAQLQLIGASVDCVVEGISARGAKLRVASGVDVAAEEQASLVFAQHAAIAARIAWRRDDWIGVQFSTAQPWLVDMVVQATEFHNWPPRPVR